MLELEGLRLERPGFSLSLDLTLARGDYGILLGPSGSGKSTALRLVAGLLVPSAGRVVIEGRDVTRLPPEKRRIGLVFQDYALFPHLSVRKNLEYGPRLAGVPRAERRAAVESLARAFQLQGLLGRRIEGLSGGEAQRVAVARSIAAKPDLLLLDEPLSSLDPTLRRELRGELRDRLRQTGLSSLHVTHDIEEAFSLGSTIFLMERGRIRERGSPEELYERPRCAFTAAFIGKGVVLPLEHAGDAGPMVRTPYGLFGPIGARSLEAPATGLYFPAARAELHASAPPAIAAETNELRGQVVATSFRGATREVMLELKPAEGWAAVPLLARFLVAANLRPAQGEVLSFRIPPEALMLVS